MRLPAPSRIARALVPVLAALLLVATRAFADPMPCALPQGVDAEHVVPVVRSVAFVQALDAASPGKVPVRPIAEDIVAVYVENRPGAGRRVVRTRGKPVVAAFVRGDEM